VSHFLVCTSFKAVCVTNYVSDTGLSVKVVQHVDDFKLFEDNLAII